MTNLNLAHQRLHNQHIGVAPFNKPDDVVRWMGAVQAQDYAAAKWAIAQRSSGLTDAAIEQAFTDGVILRTHVLRPTWHFVTPNDIRWMLALTAPRIKAANAYNERRLELDNAIFKLSNTALTKALRGGNQLTRAELAAVLQKAGIATNDLRFTHLIMRAELDAIICSGARQGKQFSYALLDERAPHKTLERDDALAELTKRYFTSHGPATLEDFAWWSGLTKTDAKNGIEMVEGELLHEVIDDRTYWFASSVSATKDFSKTAFLLPNYDEYIVSYTDRSAAYDPAQAKNLDARGNVLFNHTIVIDGRVVGTWKRALKKNEVVVELNLFRALTKAEDRAVATAAQQYGAFLDLPVTLA